MRGRFAFALCLTVVTGCGPTPQERYDTALSILERERRALTSLEPAYDKTIEDAKRWACQDVTGTSPYSAELVEMKLGLAALDPESPIGKRNLKEVQENEDVWNSFLHELTDERSAEYLRFRQVLEKTKTYRNYIAQLRRVERAEKTVKEAETSLEN